MPFVKEGGLPKTPQTTREPLLPPERGISNAAAPSEKDKPVFDPDDNQGLSTISGR